MAAVLSIRRTAVCALWCVLASVGVPVLATAAPAAAAIAAPLPPHDCDRLAANPPDPDRVVAGVTRADVDLRAAVAACEKAVAAYPEEPRFAYQLGRVLTYGGDTARGIEHVRRAAQLGYRQAYFILGALINNRREGIAHDTCQLEQYWATAAQLGHPAARVSYIRHLTRGYFKECTIHPSRAELERFIDIPAPDAEDYYLKLLLTDLKEDLARYLTR